MTLKSIRPQPSVWFPFVDNLCLQCGVAFLEAMLEPHARKKAGMDRSQIQVIVGDAFTICGYDMTFFQVAFVLLGAVYMLVSPICGQVSKSYYYYRSTYLHSK